MGKELFDQLDINNSGGLFDEAVLLVAALPVLYALFSIIFTPGKPAIPPYDSMSNNDSHWTNESMWRPDER